MSEIQNVIVDPSIILSEKGLEQTRRIQFEEDQTRVFISQKFYDLIESKNTEKLKSAKKYFQAHLSGSDSNISLNSVTQIVEDNQENVFSVEEELLDNYSGLRESLKEQFSESEDHIAQILFEEAVFLMENSVLVTRLKKVLNNIIFTGKTLGLRFSKELIKRGNEASEKIEKIKERWENTTNQQRWIAVGLTALSFGSEIISPATGTMIGAAELGVSIIFLYYDP